MSSLTIASTGIRDNETICGIGSQCQGTIMLVRGFYPPSRKEVDSLSLTTLRDHFPGPFFASLGSAGAIRQYLLKIAADGPSKYLEDVPNLQVKFLAIGGKFFLSALSSEELTRLRSDNPNDPEGYWNLREVFDLFPRKPGSKARKPTLIFRPSNWSLFFLPPKKTSFNDSTVTLNSQSLETTLSQRSDLRKNGLLLTFRSVIEGRDCAVNYYPLNQERMTFSLLQEIFSARVDSKEMERCRLLLDWFSPALLKSLLQKCIRLRRSQVVFEEEIYDTPVVLATCIALLIVHPGSFVPNIQRYVTGKEAASKRIAVSVCEDSSCLQPEKVTSLLVGAYLSQQASSEYHPSSVEVLAWLDLALEGWASERIFHYRIPEKKNSNPHGYSLRLGYWDWNLILLGQIRSFFGDLALFEEIADWGGRLAPLQLLEVVDPMPLEHCIDQHTFTDIVHYLPYRPGISFSEIFQVLWKEVTGVNPRLGRFIDESSLFVQEVRQAQRWIWKVKNLQLQERPLLANSSTSLTYSLDSSWLAGLIGPLEVKIGNSSALFLLRVEDIYSWHVIRKPGRDGDYRELTEGERELFLQRGEEILSAGVRLSSVPSTLKEFSGAKVYWKNSDYLLSYPDGRKETWEKARHRVYLFPLHSRIMTSNWKENIENALALTGEGISENAFEDFLSLISFLPSAVRQRVLLYLQSYREEIILYKVARDGSSVDYSVSPEDVAVNHFLCALCVLFPAALKKTSSGFSVANGPLLWSLREEISAKEGNFSSWPDIPGDGRELWEHQRRALETMLSRTARGQKGHGLWLPIGCGKTLIVLSYLRQRYLDHSLPSYIVYTLPPSAVDSISREISNYGLTVHRLDMRNDSSDVVREKKLLPGVINLVVHDHLRLGDLGEQMRENSSSLLLIVDEFHKTLAKTIRTSLSLEISRLATDFIVLSGTIIKDNHPEELIAWLEQLVPFEVTSNNYWVAIGALVSRQLPTKTTTIREIIEIPLTPEEQSRYRLLVPPTLGGTSSRLYLSAAVHFCYRVVTKVMVDHACSYIAEGEVVFLIANDVSHQKEMAKLLISKGIPKERICLLGKDVSVTLTSEDEVIYDVVITTVRHSAGYTLTQSRITLTSVYFSNEAAREQLIGRTNRAGQTSPCVWYLLYHTGILTYIYQNHEKARTLASAMKGFAQVIVD